VEGCDGVAKSVGFFFWCTQTSPRRGDSSAGNRTSLADERFTPGGLGGAYASRTLPEGVTLALEVGPTEKEYGTSMGAGPIVAYSDAQCVYDKSSPTA
jgi:hypothetical protein